MVTICKTTTGFFWDCFPSCTWWKLSTMKSTDKQLLATAAFWWNIVETFILLPKCSYLLLLLFGPTEPDIFSLIAMVTVSHSFPCFLFGSDNSARICWKCRMSHHLTREHHNSREILPDFFWLLKSYNHVWPALVACFGLRRLLFCLIHTILSAWRGSPVILKSFQVMMSESKSVVKAKKTEENKSIKVWFVHIFSSYRNPRVIWWFRSSGLFTYKLICNAQFNNKVIESALHGT